MSLLNPKKKQKKQNSENTTRLHTDPTVALKYPEGMRVPVKNQGGELERSPPDVPKPLK